ncbi:hypothetical protein V6U90_29095 [Micromonospora sp. CPCC 206060]|uniref:hypothetical protein n=1 Tax=Micromonospora sp. CPCC 206060 TaxID=3122406 RepID=UPI002FF0C413
MASDDRRTIAALAPLKLSGMHQWYRWGSISDGQAVAVRPGIGRGSQTALLVVIVLVPGWLLCAAGVWPLLVATVAVIAIVAGVVVTVRAGLPGRAIAPDLHRYPEIHRVLDDPDELRDFRQLIGLAERVGRTLPALDGLIEPAEAGENLAQAVWDGAKLHVRRQEIRVVLDDLGDYDEAKLPSTSRAVQNLVSQRERATELWHEVDGELARLTANLEAAAEAGENFIRERDAGEAARRAEDALAKVLPAEFADPAVAGEQLADETVAVLSAYRELTDSYGSHR